MKMRNKGKVHPFSSSSSSLPSNPDAFSVLKLLPAAILALASVLSLEDREVLAYMITRSIKSANPSSFSGEKKKNNKKSSTHKPPLFDCECFDCYTSYWFKWDSSPNRELIHQAIEAFEDHLYNGEQSKKKGKKKEKMGRREAEKADGLSEVALPEEVADMPQIQGIHVEILPEFEVSPVPAEAEDDIEVLGSSFSEEAPQPETAEVAVKATPATSQHKGLVRKVLPDVLGLFNSRLWSLWSPNV